MNSPQTPASSTTVVRLLQVFAALTVVNIAFQFVTAGRLFGDGGSVELHGAGAIVLHVVSGLAAIAAGVQWYQTRTALALAVVAAVVFVFTFIQAADGARDSLAIHIPGAFILTLGAVWVLVAALRRPAA